MGYSKIKKEKERGDEISRLDLLVEALQLKIRRMVEAIKANASGQEWAKGVLDEHAD